MDSLPPCLQQLDRTLVREKRRTYVYFGGCDYFRISSYPAVLEAVREGLERYGLNVAASRMTTGNHLVYERLEERLAQFFGVKSALFFSTGYHTNLAVAEGLLGEFTHVLVEDRSHSSLLESAPRFGAQVKIFQHRDPEDLGRVLKGCGKGIRPILLTEGLCAWDGTVAPLGRFLGILPKAGWVLLDDAHGAGVLGATGKGSWEMEGIGRERLIQTVTLSKAFGVYGGAILGTEKLRRKILARSKIFTGNTPLPLPLAYAGMKSVELLARDGSFRARLESNVVHVKEALRKANLNVPENVSPIIVLHGRKASGVRRVQNKLRAAGIYPSFIQYPGGAEGGFFRFALSSEHTRGQLDRLIEVLVRERGEFSPPRIPPEEMLSQASGSAEGH
jgi:8-amino-7-oxononanoate synthase